MKPTILFLSCLVALLILSSEASAQNCPNDWHRPPCGDPQPTITAQKKAAARKASDYHAHSIEGLTVWTSVSCAADKLGYAPARAACVAGGMALATAIAAKAKEDRIVNDPFDPNYWELYEGRWLSYDDLGLSGWLALADDGRTQNIADLVLTMELLGDRVAVSVDRVMSCIQAGIDLQWYLGCEVWQQNWVDQNLRWYGEYYTILGQNFADMAYELEQYYGVDDQELIHLLHEGAAWYNWAGVEFLQ